MWACKKGRSLMNEKNKGGRPPHKTTEETRKRVRALAGMHLTVKEIAIVMGVAHQTVSKHYAKELREGPMETNSKVASALFREAVKEKNPNITAQIFWLKCKGGWDDGNRRISLEGAGPIKSVTFKISKADSEL